MVFFLLAHQRSLFQSQNHRLPYEPNNLGVYSRPDSPAGATHTLSSGEIAPEYPAGSGQLQQHIDNDQTAPGTSDDSQHSSNGKSDGEILTNGLTNPQLKYKKTSISVPRKRGPR